MHLRQLSFNEWSSMKWQGIGVKHYAEFTSANCVMTEGMFITSSEWTSLLNLNVNYPNLREVSGNTGSKNGTSLCRRCAKENEMPNMYLELVHSTPFSLTGRITK